MLFVCDDANTSDVQRASQTPPFIADSLGISARYIPGEVIVKFRDGVSAATITAAHTEMGAQTLKSFSSGIHRLHHLKLGKGVAVENAIAKYRQHPAVEYAEPNYIYEFAGIPNDPLFNQLWALHNTGQTVNGVTGTPGADIHAPEAWDITTGSPSVIIAVIDAGIAYDHPDLAPNMWNNPGEMPNDGIDNDGNGLIDDYYGYDFVNNDSDPMEVSYLIPPEPPARLPRHGTGMAGIIAAVGNNSLGVTGVMHTAKLMALKAGSFVAGVPGVDGVTTAKLIPAGNYAIAQRARVINASFGRLGGPCSAAEYSLLSAANASGIMVVAAAGNGSWDTDRIPYYPAQYSVATACGPALPNVIAVAGTDSNDNLQPFSNFGAASVQIASPGHRIYNAVPTRNVTNILLHNFDSNPSGLGYTFSGTNNSWGFTNALSLSPPNSLTDSPSGDYLNNTNSFATGPIFSTVGQRGCLLSGALRWPIASSSDGVLVQASGDGGTTWTGGNMFSTLSGLSGSAWFHFPLVEIRDHNPINQFRLNFISDPAAIDDGAYFDDLRVDCVAGAPSGATDYNFYGGTSSATAHVTGVVGLLLAARPNLTVAEIRNAIVNTGDALPGLAGKTSTGRRLNARAALDSVQPFLVTVNKAGSGIGVVASSPAGITCGSVCNFQFPGGTTVTLTATPSAGSVFSGWNGGGCIGTGTCVLSTTAAVTATFNSAPPMPFTVTVNKNGTGVGTVTSSPLGINSGINCGVNCMDQFNQGTAVTLTATPMPGSIFSGWTGGNCVGTGICQLTVDATVTASFNLAPPTGTFNLVVAKVGTGSGTVISDPPGIDCGTTCSDTFENGATVTLTATSSSGSAFIGWSGGGCVGTGTCIVNTAATLTATFDAPLSLSSNNDGGGGCTIGQAGKPDALIPTILLVTLGALIWRLRDRSH